MHELDCVLGVSSFLANQFGIFGLPETQIMPNELFKPRNVVLLWLVSVLLF